MNNMVFVENDVQSPPTKRPLLNLKYVELSFQYLEFDGTQPQADAIVELLRAAGCEDVDCLVIKKQELSIWFVSDGAHFTLTVGEFLVCRMRPDQRHWEVWAAEDFKAEFVPDQYQIFTARNTESAGVDCCEENR